MSTLGEDALALQRRLSQETGLVFDLHLCAFNEEQNISAEQAIRAGEIIREVLGAPAKVQECRDKAWLLIHTNKITAVIYPSEPFCKPTE